MEDPTALKVRYDAAVEGLAAPLAILDVPAMHANAADLVRRAQGTPIRLATKSLRVRSVIEQVAALPGYAGLLGYSLPEALFLVRAGSSDDVVVAYPTVDVAAIADLAGDERAAAAITLMVDCVEHLDLIASAAGLSATRPPVPIKVAIDVDASYRPRGSARLHLGVRRSPVRTPAQAAALAREIVRRPGLHLDGVMAYEAQIAGVGDRPPGARAKGAAIRAMQSRSAAELAQRRSEVVAAVREVASLRFVNGGGTGSIERTSAEAAVTEVAAGSGVFGPHLFDTYSAFRPRPAALFALPVVRRPAPGWATLFSGGYLASGPADAQRLPVVHLPAGLSLSGTEGAGEVQTPVHGAPADRLRIGELVWMRHAKAGELAERFPRFHLVDGERVVGAALTYRGEGQSFG
ncbi:MAG TPA: alanine racemase [Candidatus Limnocylindrales bacterium]|nr:alanine racemase [Candidatus Limnocylindrales bacterium]